MRETVVVLISPSSNDIDLVPENECKGHKDEEDPNS